MHTNKKRRSKEAFEGTATLGAKHMRRPCRFSGEGDTRGAVLCRASARWMEKRIGFAHSHSSGSLRRTEPNPPCVLTARQHHPCRLCGRFPIFHRVASGEPPPPAVWNAVALSEPRRKTRRTLVNSACESLPRCAGRCCPRDPARPTCGACGGKAYGHE